MEYRNTLIGANIVYYKIKPVPSPRATVIFVHGFPFDHSIWLKQLEALPDGVQGIAYDIRGFGKTSVQHTFFSIDLFAQDLLEFIESLYLSNCIICGISMGGYIALRAFELKSGKISGLILSDTNSTSDSNEVKVKRFATIQKILSGGKEEFTNNFLKDVFSENTHQMKPEVVDFLRSVIMNASNDTICATLLALASRTDTSDLLGKIDVPVLVIRGEEDKLMSAQQSKQLTAGIRGAEAINIKNSGHLPNLENPENFNSSVQSFINKHFSS